MREKFRLACERVACAMKKLLGDGPSGERRQFARETAFRPFDNPLDRIRTVLFIGWFVRVTLIPATVCLIQRRLAYNQNDSGY